MRKYLGVKALLPYLLFFSGYAFAQNQKVSEPILGLGYETGHVLQGLTGGFGWAGPWTGQTSAGITIQRAGKSFEQQQAHSNRIELKSGAEDQQLYRTIDLLTHQGNSRWISFIFVKEQGNQTLGLSLWKGDKEKVFIGGLAGKAYLNFGTTAMTTINSAVAHRLFIRIDHNPDQDIAYLFVDPNQSSIPDLEGANTMVKGDLSFDRICLMIGSDGSGSNATRGSVGPIAVGDRFEDVVMNTAPMETSTYHFGSKLKMLSWKRAEESLLITTSGGLLKLTPFLNKTLQIQYGSLSGVQNKSFAVTRKPDPIVFNIKEDSQNLILSTTEYSVSISKQSSQICFFDRTGKLILQESPEGGRQSLAHDSVVVADVFKIGQQEAIYGLGQFRNGSMNLRGKRRELTQMNTQAAVPVLLSTAGWGLFWDNPSKTSFDDNERSMTLKSDYGNTLSYFVFLGDDLDDLVSQYRKLTGTAPMLPRWALGYHQSRNKYATQDEVAGVAERMRGEKIPYNSIFIDYYYWGKYGTGSHHIDESLFPDFKKMINEVHQKDHAKVVITVWPAFKPGTPNYQEMNANHYLLDGVGALDGVVYDAFNPGAAALYWKQIAAQLIPQGIDGWFLDGPEPDNYTSFLRSTTFAGPASQVRNLFPLVHSTTFYNGLLAVHPNQRPYILTRCAWASQQKNGTAIWSGDIGSSFSELQKQIPAGLNFVATGIPYWTTDIGGYSGGDPKDPAYREVYTRWWQYGAFCPIFRSHGRRYPENTKGPNELWAFGSVVQQICTAYDDLRYRLLPYIYTLSGRVTQEHYTPMRLLAFDFPKDKSVWDIKDEFMYGPCFLVNPVTVAGAVTRNVYLPQGTKWVDFWTGQIKDGGQTLSVPAPLNQIPIFVKCGSIIPFGPQQQYVDEKKEDPIELRVYTGADGVFELYEDDGQTFDYQQGAFSKIRFKWDESSATLSISARKGNFAGMLKNRRFHIVWVKPRQGTGIEAAQANLEVNYDGKALIARCPSQFLNK
jgi:alpha-D-xyloside xylohydrolase